MKKLLSGFLFLVFLAASYTLRGQITSSIEWQKCLGGSFGDIASSIAQTKDGGYIIAGASSSIDGDVTGNHGTINEYGDSVPTSDYWIVRLDMGGNIVWQKSFGGSGIEVALSIQQTSDGGFIVAGWSISNDGDVSGNHLVYDNNSGDSVTSRDCWILKLTPSGNIEWQKCLGGSGIDEVYSIQETTDGGFVMAGSTWSTDGDVSGNHGLSDVWIVKLDVDGNLVWQQSLGGSLQDDGSSVRQTSDGGFVVTGGTNSNDGDVSGLHEGNNDGYHTVDCWVAKLDPLGNIEWQKCLGGSDNDGGSSIQETTGGGFIVTGSAASNDGDVSGNHDCFSFYGCADYWVVKLDIVGNLVWQKSLGGKDWDKWK